MPTIEQLRIKARLQGVQIQQSQLKTRSGDLWKCSFQPGRLFTRQELFNFLEQE